MLVFVYGTLPNPDRVDAVLESTGGDYEFAGHATLEGLSRVDGRYPTLAPGGSVEGRLLEVDRVSLSALDGYEGVESGLYVRLEVPVADAEQSVWVYVGDPTRLGVDERVSWPGGKSFRERVETHVEREPILIRKNE